MPKLIAAINMTLDGYCDHTAVTPDEQSHQHYADLVANAGALLYGRTTYQMMERYWPSVVEKPTGTKSTDNFANAMQNARKVVFSRTLKSVGWHNVTLENGDMTGVVARLKQTLKRDFYVCSPSLIVEAISLNLVDECQFCMYPVIVGQGLPLFKNITERRELKIVKSTMFRSGAIMLYCQPVEK